MYYLVNMKATDEKVGSKQIVDNCSAPANNIRWLPLNEKLQLALYTLVITTNLKHMVIIANCLDVKWSPSPVVSDHITIYTGTTSWCVADCK